MLPFELIGMITIAPVTTDRYKDDEYSNNVNTPILSIYRIKSYYNIINLWWKWWEIGAESIENLSKTIKRIVKIPKGSHPADLDNFQLFHEKVLKFSNSFVY